MRMGSSAQAAASDVLNLAIYRDSGHQDLSPRASDGTCINLILNLDLTFYIYIYIKKSNRSNQSVESV